MVPRYFDINTIWPSSSLATVRVNVLDFHLRGPEYGPIQMFLFFSQITFESLAYFVWKQTPHRKEYLMLMTLSQHKANATGGGGRKKYCTRHVSTQYYHLCRLCYLKISRLVNLDNLWPQSKHRSTIVLLLSTQPETINSYDRFVCHDDVVVLPRLPITDCGTQTSRLFRTCALRMQNVSLK